MRICGRWRVAVFFVEPVRSVFRLLFCETGDGGYDDLPYFLYDLRPQGFLGRLIARRIALQSDDFPSDPRHWTAGHIGRYLVSNGDDLPGNLIFGEQAILRVRRNPLSVSADDYPALAESVIQGEIPGSSAGGEQQKFTAFNRELSSHVIVKFSPRGSGDDAQRWRDVMITEYYAARVLSDSHFPVVVPRLLEMGSRLFLESRRFDRIREFGRSSMISFQAVDAEYAGLGHNWAQVMGALRARDMVSDADMFNAEAFWHFGRLINNTDMHLGNLGLAMSNGRFTLLPVYDMCAMGFAPVSRQEVQPFAFDAPDIRQAGMTDDLFETVHRMAYDFWENLADDQRISNAFKAFLRQGNPINLLFTG